MSDERSHPLLAQVPLTVSPFVSLPTATTLPYTYKTLPSSLPPSLTEPVPSSRETANQQEDVEHPKPKFIVSSTGHAAHPDDIIASCQSLQAHLRKLQVEANETIKAWEGEIEERGMAEKRRVAPGYLDREEKLLEPQRASRPGAGQTKSPVDRTDEGEQASSARSATAPNDDDAAGEELDRVFGSMKVK